MASLREQYESRRLAYMNANEVKVPLRDNPILERKRKTYMKGGKGANVLRDIAQRKNDGQITKLSDTKRVRTRQLIDEHKAQNKAQNTPEAKAIAAYNSGSIEPDRETFVDVGKVMNLAQLRNTANSEIEKERPPGTTGLGIVEDPIQPNINKLGPRTRTPERTAQDLFAQDEKIRRAKDAANQASIGSNGLLQDSVLSGMRDKTQSQNRGSGIDRSISGYSIQQDGASNEEMAKFKAGGGGSQIRAGGRSARTFQGVQPQREQPEDPRKAKLWEIATTSKFPKQRQTAMNGLKLLERGEQFDDTSDENQRQFDTTSDESQRQFNTQEGRFGERNAVLNQQGAERLNIDQQRVTNQADYNKNLLNRPAAGSSLTRNQQINLYDKDKEKYNNIGRITDEDDVYMNSDKTNLMPFDQQIWRNNPTRARELGRPEPDARGKAEIELSMNPRVWAEYTAITDPIKRKQMLDNYIANKTAKQG